MIHTTRQSSAVALSPLLSSFNKFNSNFSKSRLLEYDRHRSSAPPTPQYLSVTGERPIYGIIIHKVGEGTLACHLGPTVPRDDRSYCELRMESTRRKLRVES